MLEQNGFAQRWLELVGPFLIGTILLVGLCAFSLDILSATRAYTEGESLWSKRQKEAVLQLNRYAASNDEDDFVLYERAIAVPLGDRKARLEWQKADPDIELARQGFLEGRNHPDDIGGLIRLFRNFQHTSYMRRPIALWAEGDALVAELTSDAQILRAAVRGRVIP